MKDSARVEQLQLSDPKAWQMLIDKTHPVLMKAARKILNDESDAEDVVQTILIRVWEQRAELCKIQHFEHYTRRAVRNQALNVIRKRRRLVSSAAYEVEIQKRTISRRDQPVWIAEVNELATWIESSKQALTERQQEIFSVLQADPDQSSRQIAAVLGCSHKNVLAILSRIRLALEKSHKTRRPLELLPA